MISGCPLSELLVAQRDPVACTAFLIGAYENRFVAVWYQISAKFSPTLTTDNNYLSRKDLKILRNNAVFLSRSSAPFNSLMLRSLRSHRHRRLMLSQPAQNWNRFRIDPVHAGSQGNYLILHSYFAPATRTQPPH